MKFTKEQLENWKRFEKVRASGRWNMLSTEAREASGLSIEEYWFCISNYSELEEAAKTNHELG